MTESATPKAPSPRPRRLRRWLLGIALALLLLAVGGELFSRYYLGLGDPPLYLADPDMEFVFRPSSTYHRFGNLIHYNAYSMRSDDFPATKPNPREARVMVLGDSVLNGGAQTDQRQLATSLLQDKLAADLGRPVVVGNISCGQWGPENLLAYTRHYPQYPFDADVVVIVLSTHDYWQVREFRSIVGVDPSFPDHKPLLALQEAFSRYAVGYVKGWLSHPMPPPAATTKPAGQNSADSIRQLIRRSRESGARVLLARHLSPAELGGAPQDGYEQLGQVAREMGAQVIDLGPAFAAARRSGRQPHRDDIHPNAIGQGVMAEALLAPIEEAIRGSATLPASRP